MWLYLNFHKEIILRTLLTGDVGETGAGPPTCKMGTFFQIPLALTMPISNNFQLNGASGETLKLWVLH